MVAPSFSLAAASFSDANWTTLGSGMNGQVRALAVSGSDLYAGGDFTVAGGSNANYIAKWNGSNWSALGSGMNGSVRALAMSGTNLYAGGDFTMAGGSNANHIAKWNGSSWSKLASGMTGYYVAALAVSGTNLYAGGNFSTPGVCIAKWDGSGWSGLAGGMNNTVRALMVSGNDLYVGGDFTTAGGSLANCIAKWNEIVFWSPLGSGMGGSDLNSVYALAGSTTNLYAGGLFSTAGGRGAISLAKWNGSSWTNLASIHAGSNYFPSVFALAVSGSDLYAGGDFTVAGGTNAYCIAKWNGTNWSALGAGVSTNPWALAISGSDMYVGGRFTNAGGKGSAYIARAFLPSMPMLSVLRSDTNVLISWPSADTAGFSLEQAGTLASPTSWISNSATLTDDGTNKSVTLPATNSRQFFRLRRP